MADRNHQIEIIEMQDGEDEYGQPIKTPIVFMTLWSSYEQVYGNQFFAAEQVQNGTTVKFELEYVDGITRDMFVRYNGKDYRINSDPINVKGRNTTLIIYCRDVV